MTENTENTIEAKGGAGFALPEQREMECAHCRLALMRGDKYYDRAADGAPVCEYCRECGRVGDGELRGGFMASARVFVVLLVFVLGVWFSPVAGAHESTISPQDYCETHVAAAIAQAAFIKHGVIYPPAMTAKPNAGDIAYDAKTICGFQGLRK